MRKIIQSHKTQAMKKLAFIVVLVLILLGLVACRNGKGDPPGDQANMSEGVLYTCPMPQDSIFSKEPGQCPKCGMDLVKMETAKDTSATNALEVLLQPTDEFVLSSVPVTRLQQKEMEMELQALGKITYDPRYTGSIVANISGRIEKLYVRYRFQAVKKGQRIMEIYSPELLTAQQNLLFLLRSDPDNKTMIEAAKDRLLLLGMNPQQMQEVMASGEPAYRVTVYSAYSGHIHEAGNDAGMQAGPNVMNDISLITGELTIKEGMYVQRGQTVFTVYYPQRAWALLNIYAEDQSLIKKGDKVRIVPEAGPGRDFRAQIDLIEPFFRETDKTLAARVYFDNSQLKIPIGSQVRATVFADAKEAGWLPRTAVLSLGMDKVVFIKVGNGFRAARLSTGITYGDYVQVMEGLKAGDEVAVNAQFLTDSESFIKVKSVK